jgi:endonuclease YncB( thermonuclease family)
MFMTVHRSLLRLAFAATVLALIGAPRGAVAQIEPGQTFAGKVAEVADGDTFDIRRPDGQPVTVRLWGVDAPESGQPGGSASTRAARQLIGGARAQVEVVDIGSYGRAVARVEAGGSGLGALLIRRGHAWHYERYAPGATEYARLERQARNANRGLWSRSNPIPPWDWRDGVRNRKRREAPAASGLPYDPDGPDRDCSDFSSQSQAQRFFRAAGGPSRDPHRLDGDGGGRACESLP